MPRDGEPVEGYDILTARQIVEMLAEADGPLREAVFAYESARRARSTVLEAAAPGAANRVRDT